MNSIVTGGMYSDYGISTEEVKGHPEILVVHDDENEPKWQILVNSIDEKDGIKYMKNKISIEFKSLMIK